MADPVDIPTDSEAPAPSVERGVEGDEDRFYSRSEPGSAAPLPPDPGTTPAELEETDAAGLVPEGDGPAGPPPPRRP